MKEISPYEIDQYLDDFSSFDFVIAIEAALKGHSRGRLFADQVAEPNLLILWNEFDGFYVSLKYEEYLPLVEKGIREILKNHPQTSDAFVIYLDEKYDENIDRVVPVEKFDMLRVVYYTGAGNDLHETVTVQDSGYRVLDKANMEALKDTEEVREVILSTWRSLDDFFEFGHGEIYIDNGGIKGYCISEHATDRAMEFSIEVDETYHRQGIGLNLGHRMLNYCRKSEKRPCWYCTEDNEASMKLAEKLNLARQEDFHVWLFEYEEVVL